MIVITNPTGNIGRQVLNHLLTTDEDLRVIVRDPARLPAEVRQKVDVVEGSHNDPNVVDAAFRGADAVFWLVPADRKASSVTEAYVDFSAACAAIRRHGVSRVVGVSASLAMDDLIAATGVAYRALTMPSFMDNLLRQVESIKTQGVFSFSRPGDLKAPTCATRDIASEASRLLLDRTWTGNGSVPVLGPEDLSLDESAALMSEVLGRTIRYQEAPIDAFRAQLVQFGFSDAMAQGMVDMAVAKNDGLDNLEPRTRQNSSPTSFRQWCLEVLKPALEVR